MCHVYTNHYSKEEPNELFQIKQTTWKTIATTSNPNFGVVIFLGSKRNV
jgi:hypothetical protein